MASTYTTNRSIEKPAYNDYASSGTGWSVPVNTDWDIIDKSLGSVLALNATGSVGTVNLTTSQAQNLSVVITGVMTGNAVYTLPLNSASSAIVGGQWIIYNNTSGAFSVTISPVSGGGTSVTIPQGFATTVFSDTTNILYTETRPVSSNSITNAELATIATQRLKGRSTAGTGNVEDITMAAALEFISSTQGTILYRNASAWTTLATGTSGYVLTTGGAAANPAWSAIPTEIPSQTTNGGKLLTTDGSTASWSGDSSVRARGSVTISGVTPTLATGAVNVTNSASVVRNYQGNYTITFTTALASANYQVLLSGLDVGGIVYPAVSSKSTASFTFQCRIYTSAAYDPTGFDFVVFGGF